MIFQEIGINNIISELNQNSNIMIDICGCNNKINISENQNIQNLTIKIIGNNNSIVIKKDIKIKEQLFIYVDDNNTYLEIGKNTTFENTNISITDVNNKVIIGKDCMFAVGTSIVAGDFHSIIDLDTKKRINYGRSIIIKNHVWIGLNAKILKNVCIEENSVIAAGSLVTNDIPANSIVGGVPAKVIKNNITWMREKVVEGEEILDREFSNILDSDLLRFNLESYSQEIKGWIFLQEEESGNSKLYVEIIYEDNTIERKTIPLIERGDVSDFYNNIKYLFSGFIFLKKESKKLKKIKFIIENSDFIGSKTVYLDK